MLEDAEFQVQVADRLAGLPGVRAVSLGGSRAQGTHRDDSDWDFAIYYRGRFEPQDLRDVGWAGEVSELGAWGGGVFNGGAWLRIDDRPVDVHYRDLDVGAPQDEAGPPRRGDWAAQKLNPAGRTAHLAGGAVALNPVHNT
ncbi:nucleotidyltransferase domain-containing protein, partial [Saccharopolyspora sp. NPDC002686]|uniref:nucleotidyltransferase domain-containing protein n=1 Tax=Saccharopolyspora sp. NPDC002686 TaxID=3154541 RepID=UPI0033280344